MAFRKLKYYTNNLVSIDPRIESNWSINSTSCVLTITPYTTFKELIYNDPAGISNTRMLGLVSSQSRNEIINVTTHYDIGNKNPIFIPGKMMGQINLNSGMMESINLLGGIYETLLTAFERKYQNKFHNLREKILNIPKLNTTYFEDSNTIPLENRDPNAAVAQTPQADNTLLDVDSSTSDGAILMSLSDIRTRLKFGLSLIIFQSEKRIQSDVKYETLLGQDIVTPLETRQNFADNIVPTNTSGGGISQLGSKVNYRILSGIFLENCIINNYSMGMESNSQISSPIESISIMYSSASNIKSNLLKSE